MGLTKRLFEELEIMIPDDLDWEYEQYVAEQSAMEEMMDLNPNFAN